MQATVIAPPPVAVEKPPEKAVGCNAVGLIIVGVLLGLSLVIQLLMMIALWMMYEKLKFGAFDPQSLLLSGLEGIAKNPEEFTKGLGQMAAGVVVHAEDKGLSILEIAAATAYLDIGRLSTPIKELGEHLATLDARNGEPSPTLAFYGEWIAHIGVQLESLSFPKAPGSIESDAFLVRDFIDEMIIEVVANSMKTDGVKKAAAAGLDWINFMQSVPDEISLANSFAFDSDRDQLGNDLPREVIAPFEPYGSDADFKCEGRWRDYEYWYDYGYGYQYYKLDGEFYHYYWRDDEVMCIELDFNDVCEWSDQGRTVACEYDVRDEWYNTWETTQVGDWKDFLETLSM